MNIVIDTNILGRMAEPGHPQGQLALATHGVTHFLTINVRDFMCYGITGLDPATVVSPSP